MYKLAILCAIVTVVNCTNFCCNSGGLIRFKNGTLSCTSAVLPSTIEYSKDSLNITAKLARSIFGNSTFDYNKEGLLCKEFVFDQKSGLVLFVPITISKSGNGNNTLSKSEGWGISKCCKPSEYYNVKKGQCESRKDQNKFISTIFTKYYNNTNAVIPKCINSSFLAKYNINRHNADFNSSFLYFNSSTTQYKVKLNPKNVQYCMDTDATNKNYTILMCRHVYSTMIPKCYSNKEDTKGAQLVLTVKAYYTDKLNITDSLLKIQDPENPQLTSLKCKKNHTKIIDDGYFDASSSQLTVKQKGKKRILKSNEYCVSVNLNKTNVASIKYITCGANSFSLAVALLVISIFCTWKFT